MQKDIDDIFFVPRPPFEAAPVFGKKVAGYPGSWPGTNSRFGRDPKRFNALRRKSNDFLAKIFFLTLAFMSSRDCNDQWLINHNGKRYLAVHLRSPKQQKQSPLNNSNIGLVLANLLKSFEKRDIR